MRRGLVACGAVLTGASAWWAATGDQTRQVDRHLAVFGLAFAAYLAGLHFAQGLTPAGVRRALLAALAWRAGLVLAPPLLSDDVNRLVWEGRVQVHGGNPYAWADRPESPQWSHLRDEVWRGLNHRDYTAIYPPVWQLAARVVVSVHDSVTAMKAFLVACEVLAWWPLSFLLRRRGLPPARLLVAAWSPLALVEVAGSGHSEPLAVLLLVVALAALEARRPAWAALALAGGAGAKLLPGLVGLAWARRFRPRHAAPAAALLAASFVPYLGAGRTLGLSLSKYAAFWRFNETLFAPLADLFGHGLAVRATAGAAVALGLVLAWRRSEPVASATALVAVTLLLAPSVLPWYGLWLLPLLVLRDEPALLLFTGTVQIAYLVYPAWLAGEPWHLGWGVRAMEYLPCLAVWLASLARGRRSAS